MDKFVRLDGLVAPLDRSNVDTDAIIPKQFLKSIKRRITSYNVCYTKLLRVIPQQDRSI